jgi:hypothetical protein
VCPTHGMQLVSCAGALQSQQQQWFLLAHTDRSMPCAWGLSMGIAGSSSCRVCGFTACVFFRMEDNEIADWFGE